EWISSRPLSKSGNLASSTQSLVSSSIRPQPFTLISFNKTRAVPIRPLTHAQSHMEISSLNEPANSRSSAGALRSPAPITSPATTYRFSSPSRSPAQYRRALIRRFQLTANWNQPMSRFRPSPPGFDEPPFCFNATVASMPRSAPPALNRACSTQSGEPVRPVQLERTLRLLGQRIGLSLSALSYELITSLMLSLSASWSCC
ncbi:hypothetical protein BV898_19947, partial [Hypsibius exemplaris]